MIRNPILPGFNPDPSICRVGEDYYIATSTFEWYPGVQIHHSRDLANWELVARPLNRADLLDMRGDPDSGGIWAPCLSHDGDRFWLVYTDMKRLSGSGKDGHNYVTTCKTIDGVWSDRIHVNSSGFDPSLFHDEDGRKWVVNLRWNHRGSGTGGNPAHDSFDGILLQEWSEADGLIGEARVIYHGTERGLTEGPHLWRRDGWYYLTVAEGGTGYGHAVTMARSRDIAGPYETHPAPHLFTTKDTDGPIQRVGHGQYVEAPDGTGWHTFLMGRPRQGPRGRFCATGRETGIERVVWRDGWLWPEGGSPAPRLAVPAEAGSPPRRPVVRALGGALPPEFQWLRTPDWERLFRLEADALVLIGREGLGSWFEQSLVARRQEDASYAAETVLEVAPRNYQQAAGLVTYYNRHKFHAAMVTDEPGLGRAVVVMSCPGDWQTEKLAFPGRPVAVPDGPVALRVEVVGPRQQFFLRRGEAWEPVGPELDASVISDEGGRGEHASFTGAFVGMAAYDLSGAAAEARFTDFAYVPGVDG